MVCSVLILFFRVIPHSTALPPSNRAEEASPPVCFSLQASKPPPTKLLDIEGLDFIGKAEARCSRASGEHGVQHPLQVLVLEGRRDTFLIPQLLVNLVVLRMRVLLDPDINPVVGR